MQQSPQALHFTPLLEESKARGSLWRSNFGLCEILRGETFEDVPGDGAGRLSHPSHLDSRALPKAHASRALPKDSSSGIKVLVSGLFHVGRPCYRLYQPTLACTITINTDDITSGARFLFLADALSYFGFSRFLSFLE